MTDIEQKPSNDGENKVDRNPDGTFKKGTIPNPAGKPVGTRHFTTKVKEALLKIADGTGSTHEELLVKRILRKAIQDGDGRMIQLLWEQIDGKAPQAIDLTSKGERISTLTDEQKAKLDQLFPND